MVLSPVTSPQSTDPQRMTFSLYVLLGQSPPDRVKPDGDSRDTTILQDL